MEFPEDELENTGASAEQREGSAADQGLTDDKINDILDKYDGFEELLAPLADDLDKFKPEDYWFLEAMLMHGIMEIYKPYFFLRLLNQNLKIKFVLF